MTSNNTTRPNADMTAYKTERFDNNGSVADAAALYSRLGKPKKASAISPLVYVVPAALVIIGGGVAMATGGHGGAAAPEAKIAEAKPLPAAPPIAPVEAAPEQTVDVDTAAMPVAEALAKVRKPAPIAVAENTVKAPRGASAERPELGAATPPADEAAAAPSGPTALAPPAAGSAVNSSATTTADAAPPPAERPELGATTPPVDEAAGAPSGPTALAPPPATPEVQPPVAALPAPAQNGPATPEATDQAQAPDAQPSLGPTAQTPPTAPPADAPL